MSPSRMSLRILRDEPVDGLSVDIRELAGWHFDIWLIYRLPIIYLTIFDK
jgi:hypothetical protein